MPEIPVLRVSQAIELCNRLFTDISFQVEGEVSSYKLSQGKFVFFDLKDEEDDALISCFLMAYQLSTPLEDGMRVTISGRPNIHKKSGKFSLILTKVEARGEGSVRRAFQLLVAKLEKEGLFAPERKRALPRYPRKVGIISSAEAAGYGDFMKIAESRLPGVSFTLAHVAVQGAEAEREICAAFDHLNSHYQLDCIALIRGGGSIEDLQAFNSELVARAIVRSKAPVLVGVGHERDITIADYCADVRAATPSNAAQLLLLTSEEIEARVHNLLGSGEKILASWITRRQEEVIAKLQDMRHILMRHITDQKARVESCIKTITAISPQETLKRGFSLTWDANGNLITSSKNIAPGADITTQFTDGTIRSTIN